MNLKTKAKIENINNKAIPIAIFINNINIDPNSINSEDIVKHIELTRKIEEGDEKAISLIVEGFMEKESCYKLFSFGEIYTDNGESPNIIDKKELYEKFVEELQKAEKNSENGISEILSINFPINNLECVFDIYDVGGTPVFGNGDIFFIDGVFSICHNRKIVEIKSDILQKIIS